ncbi:MAG TPA: stage 0 sporulation family protein [bacterium]|nr:stage 0 sporulation family protein [bacterium]
MDKFVQVRMREEGRIHYCKIGDQPPSVGDYVIIESERGMDYGQVIGEPETVLDENVEKPVHSIVRTMSADDEKKLKDNKEQAKAAYQTCAQKVEQHRLPMKLVDVEYTFDHSKLIFYFTAEGRIDFRELVKELAVAFRARIEMRQIGVRDEAKILGGVGCCGRELCCAKFLKDFEPVNIKMAKVQRLSLNPNKISGLCGRLLCCLKYEYKTYKTLEKNLPREGTMVRTKTGDGKVTDLNIIKQTVIVELEGDRYMELPVSEITVLKRDAASQKPQGKDQQAPSSPPPPPQQQQRQQQKKGGA